jgi:hypothetical protein
LFGFIFVIYVSFLVNVENKENRSTVFSKQGSSSYLAYLVLDRACSGIGSGIMLGGSIIGSITGAPADGLCGIVGCHIHFFGICIAAGALLCGIFRRGSVMVGGHVSVIVSRFVCRLVCRLLSTVATLRVCGGAVRFARLGSLRDVLSFGTLGGGLGISLAMTITLRPLIINIDIVNIDIVILTATLYLILASTLCLTFHVPGVTSNVASITATPVSAISSTTSFCLFSPRFAYLVAQNKRHDRE